MCLTRATKTQTKGKTCAKKPNVNANESSDARNGNIFILLCLPLHFTRVNQGNTNASANASKWSATCPPSWKKTSTYFDCVSRVPCVCCHACERLLRLRMRSRLRHTRKPGLSQQNIITHGHFTSDIMLITASVLVSEASFCGGKTNGNYQAPTTCLGYIACSNGVTSHVACPAGEKYDAVKRFCEPANRAICKVLIPSKTSTSWNVIATLKKSIFPHQKKMSNISEQN